MEASRTAPQFSAQGRKCRTCGGHGADPLSDNANWLPCPTCQGSGQDYRTEREYADWCRYVGLPIETSAPSDLGDKR